MLSITGLPQFSFILVWDRQLKDKSFSTALVELFITKHENEISYMFISVAVITNAAICIFNTQFILFAIVHFIQ